MLGGHFFLAQLNGLVVDGKPIVVEVKKTDAPLPKEVKSSSSEVLCITLFPFYGDGSFFCRTEK